MAVRVTRRAWGGLGSLPPEMGAGEAGRRAGFPAWGAGRVGRQARRQATRVQGAAVVVGGGFVQGTEVGTLLQFPNVHTSGHVLSPDRSFAPSHDREKQTPCPSQVGKHWVARGARTKSCATFADSAWCSRGSCEGHLHFGGPGSQDSDHTGLRIAPPGDRLRCSMRGQGRASTDR